MEREVNKQISRDVTAILFKSMEDHALKAAVEAAYALPACLIILTEQPPSWLPHVDKFSFLAFLAPLHQIILAGKDIYALGKQGEP